MQAANAPGHSTFARSRLAAHLELADHLRLRIGQRREVGRELVALRHELRRRRLDEALDRAGLSATGSRTFEVWRPSPSAGRWRPSIAPSGTPPPESSASSSSFATWPSANCQPLGCSWKTWRHRLRRAPGRQRPRATSVCWPSGATSSRRAAIWELSPGGRCRDHRRRAEQRVAAGGRRVEPVVGGARLVVAGAVAQAPPPLTGSKSARSPDRRRRRRSSASRRRSRRTSPGGAGPVGGRVGAPEARSAGHVCVSASTPCARLGPSPFR